MQALADITRPRCTTHHIAACSDNRYHSFLGDAGRVYIRGPGRWDPRKAASASASTTTIPAFIQLPLPAAALRLDSLGDELFLLLEDGGLYRVVYGELKVRLWRRGVRDFCWQFPCVWYIHHDNSVRSANPVSGRSTVTDIVAPEPLVGIAAPTSNMVYDRHRLFLLGRSGAVYWWRAEHEDTRRRHGRSTQHRVPAEVGRLATPGLHITALHWTRGNPGELILHDRRSDRCYYLPFDDLARPIAGERWCDCARLPLPVVATPGGGDPVITDSGTDADYHAYFQQLVDARFFR